MRDLGAANAPCSAAVARRRREHRQTIVPREWFGRADASVGERWPATAWLCIGPVGLLDGTGRERASAPLIVVDLPPLVLHEPVNTVLLSFTEAWTGRYAIVTGAGRTLGTGTVAAGDLFRDMQLGRRLQVALARVTDDERWAGARSFVPLVCASCETARRGAAIVERNLHFYSQIEFSTEGALFMRTSRTPYVRITGEGDGLATELGLPAGEALSWLSEALVLHAQHGDVLANWREYPRKCLAGREVEVKLTLHGVVDPWVLAVRAHQSARRRELPGYVAAYGNGFRRSESMNHLFEVRRPEREAGYVSFIPTADGRFLVKRKRFRKDSLVREESLSGPVKIGVPLDEYVRATFAVEPRALPPFRRARYDVHVESLPSGNVYSLVFDRSTVVGREDAVLHQAEVEYVHSRTLEDPDVGTMLTELEAVAQWVRRLLASERVAFTEGYYSKLSFLRDTLDRGGAS